jgi:hypothetical protein
MASSVILFFGIRPEMASTSWSKALINASSGVIDGMVRYLCLKKLCHRCGCFLCRRCRSRGTASASQSFQCNTQWLYVEPMSHRRLDRCRLQPCSLAVQRGSHCIRVVSRGRCRLTQWESFFWAKHVKCVLGLR